MEEEQNEDSILTNSEPPEAGPLITDEDKEKFFKSVMGDTPFQDVVSLFDDKLKITLQTMTVSQNNDVVEQISKDRENGLAENNDAYFITISTYRLALCLVAIDEASYSDIHKDKYKEEEKGVTYVRARADAMRNWPTFKLSAFLDAFNEFETKVVKLTREVKTQNFWKASA